MRKLADTSRIAGEVVMRYKSKPNERIKLVNSKDLYQFALRTYQDGEIDYKEYFKIVLLNSNLHCLGWCQIGEGGIGSVDADKRLMFQASLLSNATSFVMFHNHPSGRLTPSELDKKLTEEVKNACSIMGINIIDHLIVSKEDYYSFADNGLL